MQYVKCTPMGHTLKTLCKIIKIGKVAADLNWPKIAEILKVTCNKNVMESANNNIYLSEREIYTFIITKSCGKILMI